MIGYARRQMSTAPTLGQLAVQQRFVDEYVKDLNGSRAAERAGYSEGPSTRVTATKLMRRPKVQAAISDALSGRRERTQVDTDYVLELVADLC